MRRDRVTRVTNEPYVHTNHCLFPDTAAEEGHREPDHIENSNRRLEISAETADDLDAFFAHPEISREVEDLAEVGTCGAVVIEPAHKRMRSVWGVPRDHAWETFRL